MPLIRSLVCAAALLPLPALARDFGGFKPGDTFTLTDRKVESTRQIGYFGPETKVPPPANVPKLKNRFTIGKKGQLLAKKITIDFAHGDKTAVEYNSFDDSKPGLTFTANCELALKNKKPASGTLSFFQSNLTGANPVFRTVRVTLK